MAATVHAFGTFVSMGNFDPAPALEQVTAMFLALPPHRNPCLHPSTPMTC
jgi:hypothetical protein